MTDINRQSTDRLPIDTSKYTYREISRGSFTITCASQSTGFAGSTLTDISFLNTNNIIPEVEISYDASGGGTTSFVKLPFTFIDTSGLVSRAGWYDVESGTAKGGGFTLAINCTLYDRNSAITRTFYYKVLSAEAGPAINGTWSAG